MAIASSTKISGFIARFLCSWVTLSRCRIVVEPVGGSGCWLVICAVSHFVCLTIFLSTSMKGKHYEKE